MTVAKPKTNEHLQAEMPWENERSAAVLAARRLEQWCADRDWRGPDPYDALNAKAPVRILRRSPLALRVLTQAVKRSPVDPRPLLGIRPDTSAVTLALASAAYARNGFLSSEHAHRRLRRCINELAELRCPSYREPCWGYHFDVQTRVFFYPRTTPNTIATAFASHGLLDAYEAVRDSSALELALGAGEFFLKHVPQTPADKGAFFGYLPGNATPIHNANLLVCALLARLSHMVGDNELRRR